MSLNLFNLVLVTFFNLEQRFVYSMKEIDY